MDRKVWLPSGGTLVIDRTEAMTVVDVNTGKFTGSGGNLEQTVTRNNLEAAEEIVRQLRLRDIGGIIVIDFIDMVLESNRDLVLRRLTEALARDRTRHQVSEVTSLGLVQLTRKRLGTGLIEAFSTHVPALRGPGHPVARRSRRLGTGDAAASPIRGGRRGKRGKKGGRRPKTSPSRRCLPHPAGEHPMFKAMAAANGKHDDDDRRGRRRSKTTDRRGRRRGRRRDHQARPSSTPPTRSSRTKTSTTIGRRLRRRRRVGRRRDRPGRRRRGRRPRRRHRGRSTTIPTTTDDSDDSDDDGRRRRRGYDDDED